MKDYYKILELDPRATLADIKKAYRKLALLHHPDRNNESKTAQARFDLIKEAYETLTNTDLKDLYLQKRWLHQAYHQKRDGAIIVPQDLLDRLLGFYRSNYYADYYRTDKKGLLGQMEKMINHPNIVMLNEHNDLKINTEIISLATTAMEILLPQDRIHLIKQLEKIHTGNRVGPQLSQKIKAAQKEINWGRYRIWVILALVLLFCGLIWLTGIRNPGA